VNAALIVGGTVANVIVLADGTRLTKKLAGDLGGDLLVAVPDGTAAGPGWAYDKGEFTAPPEPDPVPPVAPTPDPVQAVIAAIGTIAAQDGPTLDEKLAAIVAVLAQNAPPTEGA
jgi:hypothetical protein